MVYTLDINKSIDEQQLSPVTWAGDFLFVAPRCGRWNRETGQRNTTIEAQTVQCLKKMKGFLEEAGASIEDIVQITVLLADIKNAEATDKAYSNFFQEKKPGRMTIVTQLPDPNMMVQMGCIAYHPKNK
jgi:2-iminobutanoate/2-iminopropanoate deaminase